MALRDEQADILGGPILQRPESGVFASFSQYLLAFKSVVLLLVGLLVWIACVRGLEHLKKHRDLRYRKAMRRKHGIPDSDCRPFAVAYAAAKRVHVEREAQDRKKTTNYVSDHSTPAVGQRTDARKDARGLRRRVPETTIERHDYQPSAKHASAYDSKCLEPNSLNFADRYNPNSHHRVTVPKPSPVEWPPVRRASRKTLIINLDDSEESRKRSFEDESDVEHETIKKSRINGDSLIDGDEQADWYAQYSDEPLERAPKKFPEQFNYIPTNNQEQSSEHPDEEHEVIDEAMEGIDEGGVAKLKAVARGKKRDRAEAGSTFGGDEDEDIRNGRASHHRKRRTILRRTIEVATRGQKRDREAESPESGGEGGGSETSRRHSHRSSKKKRGKKVVEDGSEIPVEDHRVSKDPLCGGRKVGDEWEDDGIQYRVGEKGERLRLTLVKKAKNKYHMPQDSQHPDRSAALEIYVETWMTEEHYKQAEGRQDLAWQEAPKESSVTADVFDSPTKSGKNLLWDSVRVSPARPPLRQVMSAGASTRINPFEQLQLQPTIGRRVASSSTITSPILLGVADSSTRPGFRGFSKWEKQDREAEAMARIRAKVEEEKKVQPLPQKGTGLKSVTASEVATKPISVPTITLTPAPTVAEGGLEDSTRQNKVNAPTLSSMPPSASGSVKSNTVAGLAMSSTYTPTASSSPLFPSAPAVPTTTSSSASLSPFSFAKPSQLPPPTMPNFFEKGGSAVASPSAASALGATTTSSGVTSKPAAFSFAKADSSSSAVPPTVKSQASVFGSNSGSSPSSAIFGFAPAPAKAESSLPPPALTSTASESLKPMAPLFSFSGTSIPNPSTTTLPTSSTPSAPKFLFGQPSAAPVHTSSSGQAPGTISHAKPTFKFGQASPSAVDSISTSTVRAADESKKSVLPASAFGATASLNELIKPPSSGAASAFGGSSATSSSPATNLFGKSVTGNGEASTSSQPKPTPVPVSTTFDNNAFSPAPASSNAPVLPFGINSGPESAEASKPASLFGGVARSSNPMSVFGGNSTESKPTLTFSASAQGSKPSLFSDNTENIKTPAVFGGSTEGPKLAFSFGGSAETSKTTPAFGGSVEGSKSTFAFSNATTSKSTSGLATESEKLGSLSTTSDSTKLLNIADTSKPTSPGIFASSSVSPFTFGKGDAVTNPSTFNTQTKPSFSFGTPSNATGLTFGQPSIFATGVDSSQATLGKQSNSTPSAFTFGTGASGPSGTFAFGKPASQNQKQEQ